MDIDDRVSGSRVFIGSCILSGSLLSVVGVEGGAQVTFLAMNVICIQTVILHLVIDLAPRHSTPSLHSLSTRDPQPYANCPIQALYVEAAIRHSTSSSLETSFRIFDTPYDTFNRKSIILVEVFI